MPKQKRPRFVVEDNDPLSEPVTEETTETAPDRPWLSQPMTPESKALWLTLPNASEFIEWGSSMGLNMAPGPTVSTQVAKKMPETPEEAVDAMISRLAMAQNLIQGATRDDGVYVEFPEPVLHEFIGSDGKKTKAHLALYPITIKGDSYMDDGIFSPSIAEQLREEIEGAEILEIPTNACFVEAVFHRKNENGHVVRVVESFSGPVFAPKSLKEKLKKQLNDLESITMPIGLVPGGQTHWDSFSTNGVVFDPGRTYLVPKIVKDELLDRIKMYEAHQQKITRFADHSNQPTIGIPKVNTVIR